MATAANVDLSGWIRQSETPELDGSYPTSIRPSTTAYFFGYPYVSLSSITIPSIEIAATSNEAPKALFVSASNVTAVGTRTKSSSSVIPYEDLEYRWTVTKNDDSAVENLELILDPRTGNYINPYTDQVSPEATFILREPGTYKVTLTARGMSSTFGTVITQTRTETVTVVADTKTHAWIDGTSGNDANDGLDPHGFALTTATYTHATRTLTQTGAFSSYTHDVSGNYTNRDNWIYITKAGVTGLYEIESKTDNDTIVLKTGLGSDQSSVTSSDGAKQTFNGSVSAGIRYHLKGGQSYTCTNQMAFDEFANPVDVMSYSGRATLVPTSVTSGRFINFFTTASGNIPNGVFCFSDVIIDPNGAEGNIDGTMGSTVDANTTTIIFDRVDHQNHANQGNYVVQCSDTTSRTTHVVWYGCYLDNQFGTTSATSKTLAIFTTALNASWQRIFGCVMDADADNDIFNHFTYPSGSMSHFHAGYNNFRNGNNVANFALNINNGEPTNNAEFVSVNNNLVSTAAQWLCDFGNSSSLADIRCFEKVVILNNKSNARNSMSFAGGLHSGIFAYNQDYGGGTGRGMYVHSQDTNFNANDYQVNVFSNQVYGHQILDSKNGITVEALDNVVYHTDNDVAMQYDPADQSTREFVFQDNNLYVPNQASGYVVTADGTSINLATFNASSSDISGNTSSDPSWTDPANGDFGGVPTGIQVNI